MDEWVAVSNDLFNFSIGIPGLQVKYVDSDPTLKRLFEDYQVLDDRIDRVKALLLFIGG